MDRLDYFDCNCSVGRVGRPLLLDIPDVAGLKKEMAAAGVGRALVYHTVARFGDPVQGNALLMKEIAGDPDLDPVWVILPPHTREMPAPDRLVDDLRLGGVKAVRMYPGRSCHGFSLSAWCAGEVLEALDSARVPLLLDTETVTWDEVFAVLQRFPGLPVIMTECSYRHNRFLYPLLEKFETLHVEMSRFMGAGAIEDLVGRFGPRPLLFGTNMPSYTGTAAVSLLTYADIGRADKEAIAGGNLRRLLGEAGS